MTPDTAFRRAQIAHRYYLRVARQSYPRLDEINAIRRQNIGDITPELAAERDALDNRVYQAGQNLWDAFKVWAESLGYKPVTYEDVRRYLEKNCNHIWTANHISQQQTFRECIKCGQKEKVEI